LIFIRRRRRRLSAYGGIACPVKCRSYFTGVNYRFSAQKSAKIREICGLKQKKPATIPTGLKYIKQSRRKAVP
jgi:hypothetical protein